jgi:hypothetical protein
MTLKPIFDDIGSRLGNAKKDKADQNKAER